MANRRSKNYFGLEEAICDIISQDNENDVTYDVVMLPPDLDVLTDEEEGGDDELYENKLPRDVPGNIEVVTYRPTVEDVWSSDGDEPLQTIASSTSRNVQKKRRIEASVESPSWRKCAPVYSFLPSPPDQKHTEAMGGVDQMDQSIGMYRIAVKGKKWWWVLFTYLVDLTVSNAWRLYCIANPNNRVDQLWFRRHIARTYLSDKKDNKCRQTSSRIEGEEKKIMATTPKKFQINFDVSYAQIELKHHVVSA